MTGTRPVPIFRNSAIAEQGIITVQNITHRTGMWLFPAVDERMLFQRALTPICLPTHITCIRALAAVPQQMGSQARNGREVSIADRAAVSEIIIITGES